MSIRERLALEELGNGVYIKKYENENGVSYFNIKDLSKEYLGISNAEAILFRRQMQGKEEFNGKIIFDRFPNGKGAYLIESESVILYTKEFYQSLIYNKKLDNEINHLLLEPNELEKMIDEKNRFLENQFDGSMIYLRDFIPRISLKSIAKLYDFDLKLIENTCKIMILSKGYETGFYSTKYGDITLEGLCLLSHVSFLHCNKFEIILKGFSNAYNLLYTKVIQGSLLESKK